MKNLKTNKSMQNKINLVKTCLNVNCPERTGGKCNAGEDKNTLHNKIHKEGFEAGYKKGFKVGKEAGVNSTYPVTNLDDESKNCEICSHDHSLASKECRCDCCIFNTKQKTGEE